MNVTNESGPGETASATRPNAFRQMTDELFGLAGPLDANDLKADLLLEWLDMPMSAPSGKGDRAWHCDISVGDVLLYGQGSGTDVEAIKEDAKHRARQDHSEEAREVAKVLYMAAIAAAVLRHGRLISHLSREELLAAFWAIQTEPWVDPAIADLVARAESRLAALARGADRPDGGPGDAGGSPGSAGGRGAASGERAALLTVYRGQEVAHRQKILPGREGVVIGRGPGCDVRLDCELVSTVHARLYLDPKLGQWMIRDEGSAKGTYVGGRRIAEPVAVMGQRAVIAPYELHLRPAGSVAADRRSAPRGTVVLEPEAGVTELLEAQDRSEQLTVRSVERLNVLADHIAAALDVPELYRVVCRFLAAEPGTRAAVIQLAARGDGWNEEPAVLAAGSADDSLAGIAPPADIRFSGTVLRQLAATGEPVLATTDAVLPEEVQLTMTSLGTRREVMAVPVETEDDVLEALYVELAEASPRAARRRANLDFLRAVARLTRLARNSLLGWQARQQLQSERRQLELARKVQEALLPRAISNVPSVDVAWRYTPATWLGGDYCDVWQLPDGRLAFVVADVVGKGTPAAIVMAGLHATLRSLAGWCPRLERLVREANRYLLTYMPEATLVTMFIAFYDTSSGRMEFVNAGHVPPVLFGPAGRASIMASGGSMLMGVGPADFHSGELTLDAGGGILVVTDGVTESTSPQGVLLGIEAVAEVVRTGAFADSRGAVDAVAGASLSYAAGIQQDDITVLSLIRRLAV